MKTITTLVARGAGGQDVPALRIECTEHVPDFERVEDYNTFYQEAARRLLDDLLVTAPGGLMDAVLAELCHRKASLLRVPIGGDPIIGHLRACIRAVIPMAEPSPGEVYDRLNTTGLALVDDVLRINAVRIAEILRQFHDLEVYPKHVALVLGSMGFESEVFAGSDDGKTRTKRVWYAPIDKANVA